MADTNPKRNIDERLDALTMNLELLCHSVDANASRIAANDGQIAANASQIDKLTEAITRLVEVTNEDATAIRTLARLAAAHEQRIAAIETR